MISLFGFWQSSTVMDQSTIPTNNSSMLQCNGYTIMPFAVYLNLQIRQQKAPIFSVPGGAPGGGTINDAHVGFFSGQSEHTWFSGLCINTLSLFLRAFWSAMLLYCDTVTRDKIDIKLRLSLEFQRWKQLGEEITVNFRLLKTNMCGSIISQTLFLSREPFVYGIDAWGADLDRWAMMTEELYP